MAAPGSLEARFMAFVGWVERLNIASARLGNPAVYDKAQFAWAAGIEAAWPAIRRELDAIMVRRAELPNMHELTPGAEAITRDAGWKVFLLVGYGIRSPDNIAQCPQTWAAVSRIPGLKTAMFSILEPGKRLPPHRGPYNGVLRLHLGVDIPVSDARVAIRVGDEQRSWRDGEVLIFDDCYEHSAWNESDRPRVVLFVDFIKPLTFPANILNRALLRLALLMPQLRESEVNLRRWEAVFHALVPR